MKDRFIKEIEQKMDAFFATATDEEFWAALEEADCNVYSKINIPVLDLHERAAGRFSVPARQMKFPEGVSAAFSYTQVAVVMFSYDEAVHMAASSSSCALAA